MEATAVRFDSPRTVARRFFEALNDHTVDQTKGLLSEDLVVRVSGGKPVRGKDAVTAIQAWSVAFPDAYVEVTDIVVSGNTVVTESTFTGTHQAVLPAPGLDIAATGRPVVLPKDICWIKLNRGLISSITFVVDRLALREQLTGNPG